MVVQLNMHLSYDAAILFLNVCMHVHPKWHIKTFLVALFIIVEWVNYGIFIQWTTIQHEINFLNELLIHTIIWMNLYRHNIEQQCMDKSLFIKLMGIK